MIRLPAKATRRCADNFVAEARLKSGENRLASHVRHVGRNCARKEIWVGEKKDGDGDGGGDGLVGNGVSGGGGVPFKDTATTQSIWTTSHTQFVGRDGDPST